MGVHGLTSLVDNNPHLLGDYRLYDCKVVIDGNNFYYFLYLYYHVPYQFGGDFDVFRRQICMLFSVFKKCKIEPYVVFDGSQNVDCRKLQTVIGRAKDRISAADRIVCGQRGTLLPCLAQETFKQTLNEIGVRHVTCDFEADSQMAVLANEWGCPVISCDSDFYIFSVTGGFIPLDYVDFRPVKNKCDGARYTYLPVKLYHVDHFISHCPLNRSLLPLFASILGNDYIDIADLESFYIMLSHKSAFRSRLSSVTRKHGQILSLINWLEDKEAVEDAIREVMKFIEQGKKKKILEKLRLSISGYADIQRFESFNLREYFEKGQTALSVSRKHLKDSDGCELPTWFVNRHRCGAVSAAVLNAAILRFVILPIQVESIKWPTSFSVSRHIREVLYGIILKNSMPANSQTAAENMGVEVEAGKTPCGAVSLGMEAGAGRTKEVHQQSAECSENISAPKLSSASDEHSIIEEYTRVHRALHKVRIQPVYSLPHFGPLPALGNVDKLTPSDRRAVLLEVMGTTQSFVEKFDSSLELFVMCLVYWVKNSTPKVTLHHLRGFLISAILLHVHKEISKREGSSQAKQEGKYMQHCDVPAKEDLRRTDEKLNEEEKQAELYQVSENNTALDSPGKLFSETPSLERQDKTNDGSEHRTEVCLSIEDVCRAASSQLLHKVRDNLEKYYEKLPQHSKNFQPDLPIFHSTAMLLACLLDGIHLNSVLASPMTSPPISLLLNGTFIYNVVWELQVRSNPELFLVEMLMKGSPLATLFDAMFAALLSEVGGAAENFQGQGSKCCSSSRKKKRSRARNAARKEVENTLFEDSHDVPLFVVDCETSNRFGALVLGE